MTKRKERLDLDPAYFDLQLTFAGLIAERRGIPLGEAVAFYTNFHRRFGLGEIISQPDQIVWPRYVDGLSLCGAHEERVGWTQEFYSQAPDVPALAGEFRFGCFSFRLSDDGAHIRIHFANRDSEDGVGPLSRSKAGRREAELKEMFSFVRETFPLASGVSGGSWLYHLEAYRRLFPSAYGDSRKPPEGPIRLHGTSSWGQFLDHRGNVKAKLKDAFLSGLSNLDVRKPWRAFPLPALLTQASIDLFFERYDVAKGS